MELFKKKIHLHAPLEGEAISLSDVNDAVFSQEMLGKGMAIIPSHGLVHAPCDGVVSVLQDTGHAICIVSDDGVEVLIHIGIDTCKLKGLGFKPLVQQGDRVKTGTPLIGFDLMGIHRAGYDTTVPIVVCNSDDFSEFEIITKGSVYLSDKIISLKK